MLTRSFAHCLLLLTSSVVAGETPDRPNVLIIYGDDQGSIDLGCFGVDDLQTPNLDRLAAGGIKMTQMLAPAPVCSASRVGLLTGRFPARAGQPANGDLDAGEVTIAEVFRAAGYRTGHVGKWHLGRGPGQDPGGQGFDDWFGHLGGCIDNYSHFFYWNGPNRHDLYDNGEEVFRPGEFFPRLMVDRCKGFIEQTPEDQPWLLYWAFNAPHYPYQGSPRWLEHYADLPTPRRQYNAFVSTMDEFIGELLTMLNDRDLDRNTIVIYQPDHGHSTETRAFGGGGNAGPYRGAKFSCFEGGLRVPAIVRYPGMLPAGETRDGLVTACDWLPTLAQWCDVPLTGSDPQIAPEIDGIVIADHLRDSTPIDRPPFYWQFGKGADAQWAIRDGDWKLIANPRDTSAAQSKQIRGGRLDAKYFLVHLASDPGEQNNLAERFPDKRDQLIEIAEGLRAGWE